MKHHSVNAMEIQLDETDIKKAIVKYIADKYPGTHETNFEYITILDSNVGLHTTVLIKVRS